MKPSRGSVAEEGIVLLKNENHALPLDTAKIKTIAVIGENAIRLQAHGGDSSGIKAFYEITPLQGIVDRVGKDVNIIFSEGYQQNGGADLAERAVAAAKAADVVIYIGGLNHDKGFDCEGADRTDLKLPYGQDELIQKSSRRIHRRSSSSKARWSKWMRGSTRFRRCCRRGIRAWKAATRSPKFCSAT